MKALVDLFWFKYTQLQSAVKRGDEKLIAILDREIEPALTAIFRREARSAGEMRDQFQMMLDLLREEADDRSCVLRQSDYIQLLMARYFGADAATRSGVGLTVPAPQPRSRPKGRVDDGFLNEVILDSLPDRVAVITTDYRYLYSNPMNASHLNEKPIDLVGRHIVEFIGVQRFETRVKRHLDRCFAGEMVEYDYISPRASAAITRCRMSPCVSTAGSMLGAILTLRAAQDRSGIAAA